MAMTHQKMFAAAMKRKAAHADAKIAHACFGKAQMADGGIITATDSEPGLKRDMVAVDRYPVISPAQRFADGAPTIENAANKLGGRAAQIEAAVNGATAAPAPAPVAAPAPAPAAPVQPALTSDQWAAKAAAAAKAREVAPAPPPAPSMLQKAKAVFGFADGLAPHAARRALGPGGPYADDQPAMLSKGEAILPADTVAAVGPENVKKVIDATHTPKAQVMAAARFGARAPAREMPPGFADGYPNLTEEIDYSKVPNPRAPLSAEGASVQASGEANAASAKSALDASKAARGYGPAGPTAAPAAPATSGPSGEALPRGVGPSGEDLGPGRASYAEPKPAGPAAAAEAPGAAAAQAAEGAATKSGNIFGRAYNGVKSALTGAADTVAAKAPGFIKSTAAGGAAVAGIAGAAHALGDTDKERTQFTTDLGLDPNSPVQAGIGDTVRVLGHVGRATGIPALFGVGGPSAPATAAKPATPAAPEQPAAPTVPFSDRNGADQRSALVAHPGDTAEHALGDYGVPGTQVFGRASQPGGKINDFSGSGTTKGPVTGYGGATAQDVANYKAMLEETGRRMQEGYNGGGGSVISLGGGNATGFGSTADRIDNLQRKIAGGAYDREHVKMMQTELNGLTAGRNAEGELGARAAATGAAIFGDTLRARTADNAARLALQGQIGGNNVALAQAQLQHTDRMVEAANQRALNEHSWSKERLDNLGKTIDDAYGDDKQGASSAKLLLHTMTFQGPDGRPMKAQDFNPSNWNLLIGQLQGQAGGNAALAGNGKPTSLGGNNSMRPATFGESLTEAGKRAVGARPGNPLEVLNPATPANVSVNNGDAVVTRAKAYPSNEAYNANDYVALAKAGRLSRAAARQAHINAGGDGADFDRRMK